ncbi:hypothetical protein L2E82_16849 [Cichorium intybus]|uniref:Uncharacterized protein n=1 Tax=Cichorium intybus TaxID=13427 RepID=A0ACB9F6N6_CICIN|nr:hypothetical protein L2E82_16849 [Cichorium intybus]
MLQENPMRNFVNPGHKANHSILEHYFDIDFVSCSIEKFYFLKTITTPESFTLRIYNAIRKLGEEKQNVRRRVKKVNRDRDLFVKPVYPLSALERNKNESYSDVKEIKKRTRKKIKVEYICLSGEA